MIIEFSVKNFRSINEIQTLSFATTGLKSAKEFSIIDRNNINEYGEIKLFNTIGIYGANASGKSNIVKAIDYFIKVITNQPSSVSNLKPLCQPFLFQNKSEDTESYFQIVILYKGIKYRYGMTVKTNDNGRNDNPSNSSEIITGEWLYSNSNKNMSPLFIREGNKITTNGLPNKSKIPQEIPFQHTVFLTHAAAFDINGDCNLITEYLRGFFTSDFEIKHDKFRWMSIRQIEGSDELKDKFRTLLTSFNLKYDDIILDKDTEIDYKNVFPQEKISFIKKYKFEDSLNQVNLNLKFHESSGTQKMFDLAGLLLIAFNLKQSAFIIIDEIDSNFHPSLLIELIDLFNDPEINKSKSQLLFTSHDTNLMSPSIMRRDQFYLTEKNEDNSTRLYSLADLKGIRNDADFAKQYLAGYYGAIPILEKFINNTELNND